VPSAAVRLSAADVAELVGGRLEGEGSVTIVAVGSLDQAHGDALSFLTSAAYLDQFERSEAAAVLVPARIELPADRGPKVRIRVEDPHRSLATILSRLFPPTRPDPGIHPTAVLGRGVSLGREVSIGAGAVLGDRVKLADRVRIGPKVVLMDEVEVGEESDIDPLVTCYPRTVLGARVRIKAGAVIGGPGFGYISDQRGHHLVPHVGRCVIGDDVHIGANSCVDRGSIDDTVIGAGSRLDNQVHIGHNSRLGERCLVMGGVVVAGSARIGNDVVLAGHSAIGGHFRVGDGARVGAKAGVISEVPDRTDVSGFPARPHREFLRAQAALYRLAPIVNALEALVAKRSDHG
jgi:UDP-3-O-[3-hydroxymyristoyl] glucosamine N-acyltransferase